MEKYRLELAKKTLTITKAFEERVASGEGAEYELYTRLMRDIPGLIVVRKTHKTPTKYKTKSGEVFRCNQFKNLTYKNMETFIMSLPEAEMFMNEYAFVKEYAGAVQTNAYALTRKWFVKQFPDFRTNPLAYLYTTPELVEAVEVLEEYEAEQEERAQEMAA